MMIQEPFSCQIEMRFTNERKKSLYPIKTMVSTKFLNADVVQLFVVLAVF